MSIEDLKFPQGPTFNLVKLSYNLVKTNFITRLAVSVIITCPNRKTLMKMCFKHKKAV